MAIIASAYRSRWYLIFSVPLLALALHAAWVSIGEKVRYQAVAEWVLPLAGSGVPGPEAAGAWRPCLDAVVGDRGTLEKMTADLLRPTAGGEMEPVVAEVRRCVEIETAPGENLVRVVATANHRGRAKSVASAFAEAIHKTYMKELREGIERERKILASRRESVEDAGAQAEEAIREILEGVGQDPRERDEFLRSRWLELKVQQDRLLLDLRVIDAQVHREVEQGTIRAEPASGDGDPRGVLVEGLTAQADATVAELQFVRERLEEIEHERRELEHACDAIALAEQGTEETRLSLRGIDTDLGELQGILDQVSGGTGVPPVAERALGKRAAGLMAFTLTGSGGFCLGLVLALLLCRLGPRVTTEMDVRRYLDLPLIGVIPRAGGRNPGRPEPTHGRFAEAFRTTAMILRTVASDHGMKSFVITSATAGEGKTTVAVNLARAIAREGARVVLVDGDLRCPGIHDMMRIDGSKGLSTLLAGGAGIAGGDQGESTRPVVLEEVIQVASPEHLWVLPGGPRVADPSGLVDADRLGRVITGLVKLADYVIVDTPPIIDAADALIASSIADGVVLVVGSGGPRPSSVAWAKHLLMNSRANTVAALLNKHRATWPRGGPDYTARAQRTSQAVPVEG